MEMIKISGFDYFGIKVSPSLNKLWITVILTVVTVKHLSTDGKF